MAGAAAGFYAYHIVPSGQPVRYSEGDLVFVTLRSSKATGLAHVVTPPSALTSGPFAGRALVEFANGEGAAHVRPERLSPVFSRPRTTLVCATTREYRRLARSQVTRGDSVLEVGASYGGCTRLLAQHAGSVLGVDNSPSLVEEARRRHPSLRFEQADALARPAELASLSRGCNVAFVDIGGNRALANLVELLPWVETVLAPRLLVVKSEELHAAGLVWQQQQHQQQQQQQQHQQQQQLQHQQQEQHAPGHVASEHTAAVAGATAPAQPLATAAAAAAEVSVQQTGLVPDPCGWWRHLHQSCGTVALAGVGGAPAVGAPPLVPAPWYEQARAAGFARNPLRHPLRFNAAGVQLCRPHNYQVCFKGDACPFDHSACHHCGQPGHRARDCPVTSAQ